jgi:hypothetical protein
MTNEKRRLLESPLSKSRVGVIKGLDQLCPLP